MEECFQFGWQAFDLAERFQTPVFVLSDLDLGMNQHVSRRFEYPDSGLQRGKVLSAEALEQLNGEWGRYLDRDGDGITYRTLPGTDHPRAAYFTRGTGHDTHANYSERSEDWQANLDRLHHKFETIRGELPQPIIDRVDGAQIGIISYGSNDYAIKEARDCLAAEGIATSYLRILSLPLSYQVQDFASHYDRVYVVENNHDGQMSFILCVDFPELAARFRPVARCNGLPLDADWIVDMIKEKEG
jgi:2-oxoglutarate ferredoxin oxidoreductase subunit alpha